MQRFEMVEDGASKFWEIAVEGSSVTVRFGKIGSAGQAKTNDHGTEAAAQAEAAKLIRQKTGKGYVAVGGVSAGAAVESASKEPAKASKEPAKASKEPAKPSKEPAKASTEPAKPSKEPARASEAAPVEASSAPFGRSRDAMPSTTPREGTRRWLRAPGGGRDWLGLELGYPTVLAGSYLLTWQHTGAIVRVDLATLEKETLGRAPRGEQTGGYRALALSPDGRHWAAAEGEAAWLDGVKLDAPLSHLVFDAAGSLWGFRQQRAVRLDARGSVVWEGAHSGDVLAIQGGRPVVGWYSGALVPEGDAHRRVSLSHPAEPKAIFADGAHAVLTFWLQHEGRWCWRASVVSLADFSERAFTLPGFDGCGVLTNGRLVWAAGSLDLATGATESFDVSVLGSRYAQKLYVGAMLSPDGSEFWLVLEDACAVRRFALADRREASRAAHHAAQVAWTLAVSSGGLVAIGTDEGFELVAPTGEILHAASDAQANQLAFSPDGSRLAIAAAGALQLFDVATCTTLARTERGASNALAFFPDGRRLLAGDEGGLFILGVEDLAPQARLKGKAELGRAVLAEGKIVAADADDRVYVFDDPGPLPTSKKPPTFAPSTLIPSADLGRDGGCALTLLAGHVVVSNYAELAAIALDSRKRVAKLRARTTSGDDVVAIAGDGGASLVRLGERFPFAQLEGLPDQVASSPDGRFVAYALHRGVGLFTETGGRTPAATVELVLPSAAPVEAAVPGFARETRAFVVRALRVTMAAGGAEAFARALMRAHPEWTVLAEGDPEGAAPDVPLSLFVGVVVAEAEADSAQSRKGEKAPVTLAAFARADALVEAGEAAIRDRLAPVASELEAAADWVVATGPLASAELALGKARVRLGWEDGEQSALLPKRAEGTLVAWYD